MSYMGHDSTKPTTYIINIILSLLLTVTQRSRHFLLLQQIAKIKYNHKESYSFTHVGITQLEWDVFLIA